MPELPDLTIYRERLVALAKGETLERLRIGHPFVLRTVSPAPTAFAGRELVGVHRIGKRLVLEFDDAHYAVIHLMILGRLHWKPAGAVLARGNGLAAFDFEPGSLVFVEHGRKRRASLHLVHGADALAQFERGGLELADATPATFAATLRAHNHTLKRALTDPRVLAAVGNAYSDEILHRARLSPFKQTQALDDAEMGRLFAAARTVLSEWTEWLRRETGAGWPAKVTAFRPGMAVHGRYREPCPDCGAPVQRIVYAENEANYCARCQTGGRLLADRALSRLLKDNWPRTLEELEQ